MICQPCQNRPIIGLVPGTCQSCGAGTSRAAYKLCDTCSADLEVCKVCLLPADTPAVAPTPIKKGVFFVRKGEKDAGCTVNLKVGEMLLVELSIDPHAYRGWYVADLSPSYGVLSERTADGGFDDDYPDFFPIDGEPTKTFIFEASGRGEASLELSDGRSTWKCKVKVK